MKEEKHSIKKWIYYFSLAIATIIAYNIIGNLSGIGKWLSNLLSVLMPFCAGILISYILYLPCKNIEITYKKTKKKNFLHKHARGLSILTTYIIAVIIITILLNVIIPIVIQSLTDLITNLPNYYNSVIEQINTLPEDHILRSEQVSEAIKSLQNIDIQSFINMEKIQTYIKSIISAVETIFDIFISIIVSIYILAQREKIVAFLSRLAHAILKEKTYQKVTKYCKKGNELFFKFLTSQIIDAIIVGILVSIAMSILKVKYSVLLGFMIGLFNLIPYFGAIVAVAIAILITILTGGLGKALLMAVVVIILQQIDANIINPKIVGDSLEISQLLVIFAVTIGGAYFGILGMFLAVPVVTVIKIILEDFIDERNKQKQKNNVWPQKNSKKINKIFYKKVLKNIDIKHHRGQN